MRKIEKSTDTSKKRNKQTAMGEIKAQNQKKTKGKK